MKIYFDKGSFLNYMSIFLFWFDDFKKTIGWIFGFYTQERQFGEGLVYVEDDTNMLKLLISPFKLLLVLCVIVAGFIIFLISLPFALLWNLKLSSI